MKKKVLALCLVFVMVMSLAACGSSESSGESAASEEKTAEENVSESEGGETAEAEATLSSSDEALHDKSNIDNSVTRSSINVAWNTATSIDPWGTDNDVPGNYEVYEMLFETSADGEFYALLADPNKGEYGGYDHEAGSSTYTVYLREGITDHEGMDIKASDVAYSYMYQYENATTSNWQTLVSVEAQDDYTVLFTFTEELNALGALENFFSRCFITSENCTKNLNNEMCGTGPYKFVSYTSGATLEIEKNDDYWMPEEDRRQESQANVEKITYQFSDEGSSRETGLESGALDMSYDMPYNNIAPFVEGGEYSSDYKVYTYAQKFCYFLAPNCSSDSPCSDINLREAIFWTIDQDGLIAALGGDYVRAYAMVSDYYSDYDFVDWSSLDNYNTKAAADMDKAKEYLDQSSYNGQELTIINGSDFNDVTTVIAAQLAAVGINATIKGLDQASYNSTLADPSAWDLCFGMMAGDYNVNLWSHGFDYNSNGADGTQTAYYQQDDEWNELLAECNTVDGHTPENMEKWWQTAVDNCYCMGLYTGNSYDIVPADCVYVCLADRLVLLPGSCCFDGSK